MLSNHDDSRKAAKHAKFGENRKILFFGTYRLSAKNFLRKSAVKYPVIVRNRHVVVCRRLPTNNNVFLLADL